MRNLITHLRNMRIKNKHKMKSTSKQFNYFVTFNDVTIQIGKGYFLQWLKIYQEWPASDCHYSLYQD